MLFLRDLQSTNGTFLNGRRLAADSPVAGGDRIQVADCEFVIETAMPESRPQAALGTLRERRSIDRQWVFSRFDQLMNGGVFAAYQPIVRAGSAESYGVEALARSEVEELQRPDQMFAAARRVDREAALSKLCRRVALAN